MRETWDVDLWIGVPEWPAEEALREPWEGLGFESLQVGGFFCHYHDFFGLKFNVPRLDPLASLACSYAGSDLPGTGNYDDYATSLEAIVRLRDQLRELGLTLDPVRYPDFADGYIPILAESAWLYIERRSLDAYLHPHQPGRELTTLRELGIFQWEHAQEYMEAYLKRFDSRRIYRWLAIVT